MPSAKDRARSSTGYFVCSERNGGAPPVVGYCPTRAQRALVTGLLHTRVTRCSGNNAVNSCRRGRVTYVDIGQPDGLAPLTDLLGGQVQVTFASVASSIEYIRAGKLRALAVTTATRSEMLPDVPTVGQFVPGYEASTWSGVGAPKATPAEIVEKLNKEINAALADHKVKARLADLGGTPMPMTPADFGGLIANETEKWGKVIRAANIKAE
jgi:hypothetical protein